MNEFFDPLFLVQLMTPNSTRVDFDLHPTSKGTGRPTFTSQVIATESLFNYLLSYRDFRCLQCPLQRSFEASRRPP